MPFFLLYLDLLLFVYRDLPAPVAKFLKFKFALNFLGVFARIVVVPFALGTVEFAEEFLCHMSG